jgi:hypothetical protein
MKATTPIFRVSFPNIFKPKKNDLNGKIEYSVQALFPKDADLKPLKQAVQKAVEERWGPDKTKWPKNLRSPFKDQGSRAKVDPSGKETLPQGYEKGALYLDLKSEQRPGVVDQTLQEIIDPSAFYAGCYARATVNIRAYSQAGNHGVGIYLANLQKVREGDPLGGRQRPQDDFAPIGELDSGVDSAEGLFE